MKELSLKLKMSVVFVLVFLSVNVSAIEGNELDEITMQVIEFDSPLSVKIDHLVMIPIPANVSGNLPVNTLKFSPAGLFISMEQKASEQK